LKNGYRKCVFRYKRFFCRSKGGGHGPSGPVVNTILVLKATVRKRWHLARMKDQDPAVYYRCEIDTAVLQRSRKVQT